MNALEGLAAEAAALLGEMGRTAQAHRMMAELQGALPDLEAECWAVPVDGHFERTFTSLGEVRTFAQALVDKGCEDVEVDYYPDAAADGIPIKPEGPWLTVPDDLMRPKKEGAS